MSTATKIDEARETLARAEAEHRDNLAATEAKRRDQRNAAMRREVERVDLAELDLAVTAAEATIVTAVGDGADYMQAWVRALLARERAVVIGGLIRGYAEALGTPVPQSRMRGIRLTAGAPRANLTEDIAGQGTTPGSVALLFGSVARGVTAVVQDEADEIRGRVETAANKGLGAPPQRGPAQCIGREHADTCPCASHRGLRERQARERARVAEYRAARIAERNAAQRRRGLPEIDDEWFGPEGGLREDAMPQALQKKYAVGDWSLGFTAAGQTTVYRGAA